MEVKLVCSACLAVVEFGELLGIPDEELLLEPAMVIAGDQLATQFNIGGEEEFVALVNRQQKVDSGRGNGRNGFKYFVNVG